MDSKRLVWLGVVRGVEQLIERSTDGGVTWTRGAVVELVAG